MTGTATAEMLRKKSFSKKSVKRFWNSDCEKKIEEALRKQAEEIEDWIDLNVENFGPEEIGTPLTNFYYALKEQLTKKGDFKRRADDE